MSKFNLGDYETVKSRKKRFYKDYKDGRIVVFHVKIDPQETVMRAEIYKNSDDQCKGLAFSTGYAQEFKGQGGFANKHAWTENCEESAVGRALDNAGYAGNDRCSQEEIIKVQRAEQNKTQSGADLMAADMLDQSPGKYKAYFGKFAGKPLEDIPENDIVSYLNFLNRSEKLTPKAKEWIEKAQQFLEIE